MPLLSTSEALHVSDSFLSSLYGDDIFRRWKELKDAMKFLTEREYVSWLIDVANHYNNEDESQQLPQETVAISNLKSEESLDHFSQGQGQAYETPVSEYSHLSSTQGARNSKNYNEQFTLDTKVEGVGNSNEQTSVTSQVDDYKYEQSYYDEGREDERMSEMERNDEILLSSDDEGEGGEAASGAIDDGNEPTNALQLRSELDFEHEWDSESSIQRHKCPHCSYSTGYSIGHIKRHIISVHERRRPFSCEYCDYKCSEGGALKRHLVTKHGYKSKYCCSNCHRFFHAPSHLHKHYASCIQKDTAKN